MRRSVYIAWFPGADSYTVSEISSGFDVMYRPPGHRASRGVSAEGPSRTEDVNRVQD